MSEKPAVVTERHERVLVIRLNRPEARNAVNGAVARGMEAAVDELENADDLWAGVLAGNGKVFCAGADLKEVAAGRGAELQTERGAFGGFVRRKRTKPIIAAVHADAFAGGFELALACDLIVAGTGTRFGLPEVKRSLVAVAGGLVELPNLIGEKLALEIALLGQPVAVDRLHAVGLISRVVAPEAVVDTAIELASTIADNGPLAVAASRSIIIEGRDLDTAARWDLSYKIGLPVFGSEDAREGPRAFIEKRKPVWKGK
jgi:enoyl-CoA hydratase